MRNAVGRRNSAPNPWEERWTPAFPVSSNRKNQKASGQNNYCYVCVAKTRPLVKSSPRNFYRRPLIDLTLLEIKVQIRLEQLILVERIDAYVASSPCAEAAVNTPGIRVGEVERVLHQPACIQLSGQGLAD